jgi:hypothetical protein
MDRQAGTRYGSTGARAIGAHLRARQQQRLLRFASFLLYFFLLIC